VEAALLLGALLPPPAALAFVLAGEDGAGPGLAANADHAAGVEGVVGDVEGADRVPDLGAGGRPEGAELDEGAVLAEEDGVVLGGAEGGAGARALVAALAGDPGAARGEVATEGLDLADLAALIANDQ